MKYTPCVLIAAEQHNPRLIVVDECTTEHTTGDYQWLGRLPTGGVLVNAATLTE